MLYAALDSSGEWKDICELKCDGEWFECDCGEAFTNAVGDKITLMEYCRLIYSENNRDACAARGYVAQSRESVGGAAADLEFTHFFEAYIDFAQCLLVFAEFHKWFSLK